MINVTLYFQLFEGPLPNLLVSQLLLTVSLLLQPLRNYLPRPQIKDGVRKVGWEPVLFVKRVKHSRQKTQNINLESTFLQINSNFALNLRFYAQVI